MAAVDRHGFLPELRCILSASYERPAGEVLPETVRGISALLAENDDLVRVFFRESRVSWEVGKRLADVMREEVGLLARYLAARIAVGELRPHDPEVAARTLLYTVQMLHMTGVPADGFVPEMVEILLWEIKAD